MAIINLRRHPFYDDFDPSKNFHRILFKPGFSVQARELTQAQTILQNQIERFANHVFKDGSVVEGCAESHNFSFPYVKILDTDTLSATITDETFESLPGNVIIGLITGVRALVKDVREGSESDSPNLKTLYVQYISSGLSNEATSFEPDEPLQLEEDEDVTFVVADIVESPVGVGSLLSLGDGVVYANGSFVRHHEQSIVLEPYETDPTKLVGYIIVEEVVTSDDDQTLYEPARGSHNFAAPGADRYKLTTELVVLDTEEERPEGFFLLFEVVEGVIHRRYDRAQYAELGKEIARRTYDESGDYTVRPFGLLVREHLNSGSNNGRYTEEEGGDTSKLAVGVEPGKAYIRGFEHETRATEYLDVDKAITTDTTENQAISTSYGNYLLIDDVVGPWSLNSGDLIILADSGELEVGTARVRDLQYHSGTIGANAVYRLYLYDIQLTDASFSDVALIITGVDVVASYVSGPHGANFGSMLFPTNVEALKETSDESFVHRKQYTGVAVSAGGLFSVSCGAGEVWAFSAVDDLTVEREILVIAETEISGGTFSAAAGEVLNVNGKVTLTSTTVLDFDLGGTNTSTPTVTVIVNVRKTTATPKSKTLRTDRCVKIDTGTHTNTDTGPYSLGFSDVFRVDNIWMAANTEAYPNIDLAAEDPDSGTWEDVTSQFDLNNGQRDGSYDVAFIEPNNSSLDLTDKKLIIKLAYFEHSGSSGYYTVNSYPLPAINVAPTSTEIEWWEIPVYVSTTGETFDLRNTIDFRVVVDRVANDKTLVNSGTPANDGSENPVEYTETNKTFNSPIVLPVATEEFITDFEYFLGRTDRITISADGEISVVSGIPSLEPVRPRQPENTMTIGFVSMPPYPSLSPFFAQQTGKKEYGVLTSLVDNRRFTMQDIGGIQRRISRLEYYTSLSLLEQSAVSLLIPSGAGEDRFKNGILVDAFDGHNIGNVLDPAYLCSIADHELRPYFNMDNVEFDFSSASGVVRKAADANIVVRQVLGETEYQAGEQVSVASSGASGTIAHVVVLGSNESYAWVRLYLNVVTGTFAENNVVNGNTSSATGTITYTGVTTEAIAATQRPSLVSVPTNGNLVTLPYIHAVLTGNDYASKVRNCVSALLFTYEGTLILDPPVDVWVDTNVLPEVQNNPAGLNDNWTTIIPFEGPPIIDVAPYSIPNKTGRTAWGSQWNIWTGRLWETTPLVPEAPQDDLVRVNEFVIDRFPPEQTTTTQTTTTTTTTSTQSTSVLTGQTFNLIPYMRSKVINFSGTRMKPNTKVYAFFDGVDVSEHCKLSSSTTYGTSLVVDDDGNISGQFRIPASRFTVGTKTFILADSTISVDAQDSTTIATANYTASGLTVYEQRTVQSTQRTETSTRTQLDTEEPVSRRERRPSNIPTNKTLRRPLFVPLFAACMNSDPIAQTFFVSDVPNGVLATKFDVYFKTKSQTSPITLQIREVVNGYPTDVIVPYSTVTLHPRDVNVSDDASAPTEFRFSSPVHLKNDTEYCFVLLPAGNDENYNVWVSELGQNNINTTERIDKQPNTGVLFVSANNRTWTAFQAEDIKFSLYAAEFGVGSSGTLVLKNKPIDFLLVSEDVLPGDTISSATGAGTVKYYDSILKVAHVEVTSGFFEVGATDTDLTIDFVGKVLVNSVFPKLSVLDFNNTDVTWEYKIYDTAGNPMAGYLPLSTNGTSSLPEQKAVFSFSEENISFNLRATLSTEATNIGPVVDLAKVSVVAVSNFINNVSTNEETNSGDAASRYITRKVVLDDGQEAEDLQVYLTASLPPGTSLAVYAKLLSDVDDERFENRPWLQLSETAPLKVGGTGEYLYTIPSGNTGTLGGGLDAGTGIYEYTDGSLYSGFKTFAIKIVPLSSNSSVVPVVRDMRAIALQV